MACKHIMFQGTASNVGKSVLVAAMCRILKQDGFKIAPFKSQNMALNSYVTKDGGEMGRAQVVQAEAAGIDPTVDMNPVLLKPTGDARSQVVVLGKPVANMNAKEYHIKYSQEVIGVVRDSLDRLEEEYEVLVIEGAGSPAEVNLQATDIVNMRIARMTNSPVLLIADIDKGGALASIVGTIELVAPEDRERIAGVIINKFRGDVKLLQPALDFLEEKTGKPVVGVIPYFQGFRVQEEDGVARETMSTQIVDGDKIDIAVVQLPHISNFTDFDALEDEADVQLRYVGKGLPIGNPDLIILPGTKNTIEDLIYLKDKGYAEDIIKKAQNGTPVIGICGGFQMLGNLLSDPEHTESAVEEVEGLKLIPMETIFELEKITSQIEGLYIGESSLLLHGLQVGEVTGYEIHMGRTTLLNGAKPAFRISKRSLEDVEVIDGAINENGTVMGTYIHGIFDNDILRRQIINNLRVKKGFQPIEISDGLSLKEQRDRDFDSLAKVVRESLNMPLIYDIMGLIGPHEAREMNEIATGVE